MNRVGILLVAIVATAGFLAMVKVMFDMSDHMGRMTDQVAAMTADVHAMRESLDHMAVVFQQGGQQMKQIMNPMEMLPGTRPPGR